ncbi:MAG: hypothetical protein IPP66_23060 [Anaerolineales bacterium]|nr:hypothetical protein [Anaerolineales bacterium]
MNKHYIQSILKFTLLIVTILSAGCGRSTLTASPETMADTITPQPFSTSTSVPTTPTITVTPLPCYSWTQTPTTDLEKIAENWFLSNIPQIPERSLYQLVDAGETWSAICYHYQYLILTNDTIAQSPIEISLHILTQSAGQDYFYIDNVIVAAVNSDILRNNNLAVPAPRDRNIMTVIVTDPYIDVQTESRIDFVFENDIWEIKWWGYRWKCITGEDIEWKNTENIYDC